MRSHGWVRALGVGVLSATAWLGCSDNEDSGAGGASGSGGGSSGHAGTDGGGEPIGGKQSSGGSSHGGFGGAEAPLAGAESCGEDDCWSLGGGGASSTNPGGSGAGGGGQGGEMSGGGEGGETSPLACDSKEYRLPHENRCRACTNWVYEPTSGTGVEIGDDNTYDRTARALSVRVGEGLPLPVSWTIQNVTALNEDLDPISCPGQVTYSVRDNQLRADLSALVDCGAANATLSGFALNFGCAGALNSFASIDVALTGDEHLETTNDAELGPFKTWLSAKPFPPFIGETTASACGNDQYREAGYPECRACGKWHYSAEDESCRVFGTHHVFHPETGEVVIEPGPDMPLPIGWQPSSEYTALHHSDPSVQIPPCDAEVHASVRNGLLIADVSEFQACAAGLPPGAGLDFGGPTTTVDYGCAGSGCATQYFVVEFDGGTHVGAGCLSAGDWPAPHYD